jgi:predicted ArsR family transcriptional regulator
MLSLLTGAPMSAAELARELGVSQALASYHLRFLVEADAVELAEEVVNRGGRERRYRYRTGGEAALAGAGVEGHELMLTAAVEELRRRHADRAPGGTALTIDAELWVAEDEWRAFRDAVRAAGVRLHEQAARPRTPGTRHVNATVLLFEMTP